MGRIRIFVMLVVLGIPGLTKFSPDLIHQLYMSLSYTVDKKETLTYRTDEAWERSEENPLDAIILDPMEALDLVKEAYATNFIKKSLKENPEDYFYKLDIADYYLVYEDTEDSSGYYIFHLYEFVLDDQETGIGHTVTYGWYWVNPSTGDIWVY